LGPLYWPLPTIYLEGKPEYNHISSTLIRNISQENNERKQGESIEKALEKLIPPVVAKEVAELYAPESKKDS